MSKRAWRELKSDVILVVAALTAGLLPHMGWDLPGARLPHNKSRCLNDTKAFVVTMM